MSGPFGSSQWMYKPDAGIPWGGARGVFAGETNVIDYITIQSTGDAQDFGDLTQRRGGGGGCSNATRGVFMGGEMSTPSTVRVDTIDFVSIS